MRRLLVALALCAAMPVPAWAQTPAAVTEDAIVARLAETPYTLADIRQRLARLEAPYRYAAERRLPEFVKDFLRREALAREARKRALDQEPAVRAELDEAMQAILIRALFKQVSAQALATPEEVQSYYSAHEPEFSVPEQVEADEVVVPNETEAVAIRSALQAGKSLEVAVGARGTVAVATFARGAREPDVEQAVFALAVGDVSPPLTTRRGIALFRLRARHPPHQRALEAATAEIQARLSARKQEDLWKDLQNRLWAEDQIAIDEDRLRAAVPAPPPPAATPTVGVDPRGQDKP